MSPPLLAFRWVLALPLALVLGGYGLIAIVGSGFRRSFGASPVQPLLLLLPAVIMTLMLVALIIPTSKPVLHAAAAAALIAAVVCLWCIIKEGILGFWLAVAYLGAWFIFYGQIV